MEAQTRAMDVARGHIPGICQGLFSHPWDMGVKAGVCVGVLLGPTSRGAAWTAGGQPRFSRPTPSLRCLPSLYGLLASQVLLPRQPELVSGHVRLERNSVKGVGSLLSWSPWRLPPPVRLPCSEPQRTQQDPRPLSSREVWSLSPRSSTARSSPSHPRVCVSTVLGVWTVYLAFIEMWS